jgi:hypothetical protein
MEKINTLHFSHLRNDAHVEFMNDYKGRIDAKPAVKTLVDACYPDFASRLAQENALFDALRKSIYTKKIAEADRRIDHTLAGADAAVTAALHLPDPAVAEAARAIQIRIKAFGRIAKKTYEEESADVKQLLADLQSAEYAGRVALTGLAPYLTELAAAEAEFEEAFSLRLDETADKPQGRMIDARHETEASYRAMNTVIDAYNTLHPGDPDVVPFIRDLNAEITYFNNHDHHHARKDLSKGDQCVVEPVDVQKYTEKAVTPIPKAFWKGDEKHPTVELVFAKDFSVSYKNNVDVGTADLTLHGKGDYKGQKTVTFNIAR